MAGTLYIIATPIGNLEDITLRALRILKEVDLILAEDTRVTSKLLSHYEIVKPTLSYHQHSSDGVKLRILKELVGGKNLALVTDAGTPGISDPGGELIDFLLEKEPSLKIVPIPGSAAVAAALSICGFRADKFVFTGFLPKKGKQNKLIELNKLIEDGYGIVFYESPHRIIKTLETLSAVLGKDRRVFLARELTKLHESLYRGPIEEVIAKIGKDKVKGEVVVVVEGK